MFCQLGYPCILLTNKYMGRGSIEITCNFQKRTYARKLGCDDNDLVFKLNLLHVVDMLFWTLCYHYSLWEIISTLLPIKHNSVVVYKCYHGTSRLKVQTNKIIIRFDPDDYDLIN